MSGKGSAGDRQCVTRSVTEDARVWDTVGRDFWQDCNRIVGAVQKRLLAGFKVVRAGGKARGSHLVTATLFT